MSPGRAFHRSSLPALAICAILLFVGCAEEEYPAWLWDEQHPAADAGAGPPIDIVCNQARAESLPARLVAMSANAVSSSTVVLESDIFQRFVAVCGACHGPAVDQGQGGFQITTATEFAFEA